MSQRAWIVLLTGVNLLLMGMLLSTVVQLPSAHAQSGRQRGSFVSVTAKAAGQQYDVLYVLDSAPSENKLHAFYPSLRDGGKLRYAKFRDLAVDFGEQSPNP